MSKTIDITDKLSFDDNPVLRIGDQEFEVNADAETVLRIIGALRNQDQAQAMLDAMNLMFTPEDIDRITKIKDKKGRPLTGTSLAAIIQTAVGLVVGGGDSGE